MKILCQALMICLLVLALSSALAEAPVPANANGVITAAEWEALYPDIVKSYHMNEENSYRIDYLEKDPYLVELYEGYGFAKDYTSAIGHTYTLQDVGKTERPHPLANCITCKTPDFTKLVIDMGEAAYSLPFEDVYAQMQESISCYNCHANTPGTPTVTHTYVTKALGDQAAAIPASTLACGQCHIEYHFEPDSKATAMPYHSVEEMTPEAILAYYDAMGFADWTQPSTGTPMLKAQHPELETYLNGSIHSRMGLTCAQCHMPTEVRSDGTTYRSHTLQSPLQSESLLATCAQCHKDTDMKQKVQAIQAEITARETEVGTMLASYKGQLAEAVESGAYSEEALTKMRQAYRQAQWYWDFCYVENSEGAHNSALSRQCLDRSQQILEEASPLFEL